MKRQDVVDAYIRIRTIDNTIPDEVLDFMKNCAIEKLEVVNKNDLSHIVIERNRNDAKGWLFLSGFILGLFVAYVVLFFVL